MRQISSMALATVLAAAVSVAADPAPLALVICAPGYPSNTKEAQPSMDKLAGAVATVLSWPAARLTASYYETHDAGVARLRASRRAMALVPLPFYLLHAKDLKLTPRAQSATKGGQVVETWTLVAKKGRVSGPAALAGWEVVSLAAYAPEFVRKVALSSWGTLPKDVRFVASGQALTALRRASTGENVAVLLDAEQQASLSTLPFAADLETVATSAPVPSILLCSVGAGVSPTETQQVVAGLLRMHETPDAAAALDAVRLTRFVPLDAKALSAAQKAYGSAGTIGPR